MHQAEVCFKSIISIHAPTKGATLVFLKGSFDMRFQSTLPRRERHVFLTSFNPFGEFQSTLPRRERLLSTQLPILLYSISIHAPTKGATLFTGTAMPSKNISIHAPTKGATAVSSPFCISASDFNPRSHEGSDLLPYKRTNPNIPFQSTLPRRERQKEHWKSSRNLEFQSTLPRRERPL